MRLIVVTTCTDRKRYPVSPDLDASTLDRDSQVGVTRAWTRRLRAASAVGRASEVYCGRSFQEALLAAKSTGAELRIVSGGLGLVRSDEAIPSYSLSLVSRSPEFVGSRVVGGPFSASKWWSGVQKANSAPLAALVQANRSALAVIGISSAYLSLIAEDLASLIDDDIQRLRLVGLGIHKACPPRLRPCILPYDDRLDGPDSPIRGTRGDFASRAMRHFIERISSDRKLGSIEAHRTSIKRSLSRWRRPQNISRPSRSDDEIIRLIKKNWRLIEGQVSRGLRHLRDVEEIACEQSRFRALFSRAAAEVAS